MDNIDVVATMLSTSERIVFLTGAGLSVASGIAPYRKSKDAVWSRLVTDWATIAKFHEDPLAWWKEFWLVAHGASLEGKSPNAGHDAITRIATTSATNLVVTQNIDGLHRLAKVPEAQLVEIHGRHDRFICTHSGCRRVSEPLTNVDLSVLARGEVPRCDLCNAPVRPLVLLFDETYDSHAAYNMRAAKRAFNDAEVILFVGTSFSVGITDYAIRAGAYAKAMLVNVNIEEVDEGAVGARFVNILGPSEETLPALAALLKRR